MSRQARKLGKFKSWSRPSAAQPPRVHIVLARAEGSSEEAAASAAPAMMRIPEVEVPKVEHDGQWHTLH